MKTLYDKSSVIVTPEKEEYLIDPNEFNEEESNPEFTKEGTEFLNSLNLSIGDLNNKSPVEVVKTRSFTQRASDNRYNIDNGVFEPSKLCMASGRKFKDKYIAQLEKYIFNTDDTLDPANLFTIIRVFEMINDKHVPIQIVTSKFVSLVPRIIEGLEEFFSNNYEVMKSIYYMINNSSYEDVNKEG